MTGSGSELGHAVALCLERAGWQIALADVDQTRTEATLEEMKRFWPPVVVD